MFAAKLLKSLSMNTPRQVLCVQFPGSFRDKLSCILPRYGLKGTFVKFSELTLLNGSLLYKGAPVQDFDFVLFGLVEKFVDSYFLLLDYIKRHNKPHLVYGNKNAGCRKTLEILRLSAHNIPIVPSLVSSSPDEVIEFTSQYPFPIVSKPIDGRKGHNVLKHQNIESVLVALKLSATPLILQPFIPNDGDYRVWVLQDRVLGVIKRTSQDQTEFRHNVSLGGLATASELPETILQMCLSATKAMNFDMAGVDVIQDLQTQKYFIMEVNSGPQYQGFLQATGINPLEEIAKEIQKLLEM